MANRTIYGQRYGVQPGSPYGPGKSGLTPLSPLNPAIALRSPNSLETRNSIEDYQRWLLSSYTTQLLRELDCITERDLKPNDLTNEIFRSWRKDRWDTEENYPHSHTVYDMSDEVLKLIGQEGQVVKWVAGHEKVWAALKPCLKLGTRILEALVNHPWFDAVLLADREEIPANRFPPQFRLQSTVKDLQTKYKCFNLRSAEVRGDGTQCREVFKRLIEDVFENRLTFGLMHDQIDPFSGDNMFPDPDQAGTIGGLTAVIPDPLISPLKVWISYSNIAPLLRTDLSSSERLMETWSVAVTIVHETIHAFHKANSAYEGSTKFINDLDRMREAYFALEQENELGRSGEAATYGGMIDPLIKTQKEETAPHLGFVLKPFPEISTVHNIHGNPRLINPSAPDPAFAIPISVTYYENLNSEQYWDIYVKKFGINGALKPPKVIDGIFFAQDPNTLEYEWKAITEQESQARQGIEQFSIESLSAMTPAQRGEHEVVMKRYQVAIFQPMMAKRDAIVRDVMESVDFVNDLDQTDPDYYFSVEGLSDAILKLLEIHAKICTHLVKVEANPGTKFGETKTEVLAFHQGFKDFIQSFLPNKNALARTAFSDFRNKLDLLSTLLGALKDTLRRKGNAEGEEAISDAIAAYIVGDQQQCNDLCNQALSIIAGSLHLRIAACFLVAKLDIVSNAERLARLRQALRNCKSLDLGDISLPLQPQLQQLLKESSGLLTELEAEEKKQAARISCT
ncbi:hypothetical protein EG329_006032 [Mollisiaceae sp. DMI_Dod_QoI]|nr:hypothetical protein EG329_006032 [Helotiales sp. DMI_Dod_QoI]